ncbi:MAG: aldo/keto reductase [Clostridiales bacterium]|nr:aldo/keto reductase [Clostridiales bacterium]
MKYGKFHEYDVARVILGVGGFGAGTSLEDGDKMLKTYMEQGGNTVDTGNVYGNWTPGAGRAPSEKAMGQLFKEQPGLREKLIICTKGAHYEWYDVQKTPRVNEGCITYDIHDSLKNFGVDKLDIYWLHRDNPTYPVQLIMDALFEAQDAGKIGHFGASNWSARRIIEANEYARSCKHEGFTASQIMFSYAKPIDVGDRTTMYFDEAMEGQAYLDEKLALFCYTSQARGYVTKIVNGTELRGNIAHDFDCPANRERAARADEVAKQIGNGHTAEQVGLAYLHGLAYNTFAVFSTRSLDQCLDTTGSCDIDLSPEQVKYLAEDKLEFPFVPQLGH